MVSVCDNTKEGRKTMIALPPDVEKKLALLAQEAHTTVAGYLSSIVSRLPEPKLTYEKQESRADTIAAKLAAWQAEDGSPLLPDTSVKNLFSRFRAEDAETTETERKTEYALWVEIEKSLQEQRGLVL